MDSSKKFEIVSPVREWGLHRRTVKDTSDADTSLLAHQNKYKAATLYTNPEEKYQTALGTLEMIKDGYIELYLLKDNRPEASKDYITTAEINLTLKMGQWLNACYMNLAFAAFYGHTKSAELVAKLISRETELKILKRVGITESPSWGQWAANITSYIPGMLG